MIKANDKMKQFLFLSACALMILLFAAALASAQDQPIIDVSVQITSGRTPPGWIVNKPDEIAQLKEFLKGLPSATPVEEPSFGAFLLTSNEAISGFPRSVLIFKGVIRVSKLDRIEQFFQDVKGLRTFLVKKAVEHGINIQ